jgi:hypothetical protein
LKLNTPYFEVCDVDDALVDALVSAIDEADWSVANYRKVAMSQTDTIPIHHTPLCYSCADERTIHSIRKEPQFEKFEPLIRPILELLRGHYTFNQYAAFIARLYPNGQIAMHPDVGVFLETCHRIHIPLQTNPRVAYCIEDQEYYWPRGKIYEFDNTRLHGVKNRSDEMRIHLVVNLYNLETQA